MKATFNQTLITFLVCWLKKMSFESTNLHQRSKKRNDLGKCAFYFEDEN